MNEILLFEAYLGESLSCYIVRERNLLKRNLDEVTDLVQELEIGLGVDNKMPEIDILMQINSSYHQIIEELFENASNYLLQILNEDFDSLHAIYEEHFRHFSRGWIKSNTQMKVCRGIIGWIKKEPITSNHFNLAKTDKTTFEALFIPQA